MEEAGQGPRLSGSPSGANSTPFSVDQILWLRIFVIGLLSKHAGTVTEDSGNLCFPFVATRFQPVDSTKGHAVLHLSFVLSFPLSAHHGGSRCPSPTENGEGMESICQSLLRCLEINSG